MAYDGLEIDVGYNSSHKDKKRKFCLTQYFLRHTFATTCVQYVRPDIVDTWMGDSSERLVGRVYTHFPDKFMTNQMDLV